MTDCQIRTGSERYYPAIGKKEIVDRHRAFLKDIFASSRRLRLALEKNNQDDIHFNDALEMMSETGMLTYFSLEDLEDKAFHGGEEDDSPTFMIEQLYGLIAISSRQNDDDVMCNDKLMQILENEEQSEHYNNNLHEGMEWHQMDGATAFHLGMFGLFPDPSDIPDQAAREKQKQDLKLAIQKSIKNRALICQNYHKAIQQGWRETKKSGRQAYNDTLGIIEKTPSWGEGKIQFLYLMHSSNLPSLTSVIECGPVSYTERSIQIITEVLPHSTSYGLEGQPVEKLVQCDRINGWGVRLQNLKQERVIDPFKQPIRKRYIWHYERHAPELMMAVQLPSTTDD